MTPMHVKVVESDAELARVADTLLELRDTFDKAGLIAQIKAQQAQGYELAYVEADGAAISVAGFVIGLKLAWGRHMYIDDLVTAERHRSTGAGGRLIEWLVAYARERGCGQIHLDSGVQRYAAHRFYLRHGFEIRSHHFSITS